MKPITTLRTLTRQMIERYRRQGFIRLRGVLSEAEAQSYHEAALALSQEINNYASGYGGGNVFHQIVNVWRHDLVLRRLTFHPNISALAQKLAGVDLKLWHDQVLIKRPRNAVPTQFHQDQPYWSHGNSPNPITAWIALCDVPVERGCMTFIPESHLKTDLPEQHLNDPRSLFTICPELEYYPRVTVPLKAGDCTFHHGRCAHMATPNLTDLPRMAHVVIYMAADTRYRKITHLLTDPLELTDGAPLDGPLFPTVAAMQN